jgi:hypothetical protein
MKGRGEFKRTTTLDMRLRGEVGEPQRFTASGIQSRDSMPPSLFAERNG